MRLKFLLFSSVLYLVPLSAQADLEAGMEYFSWREYRDSGDLILQETGPRGFLAMSGRWGDPGLLFAETRLRGYLGFLEYAGEYLDGTPATTETWYFGATGELLLGVRPVSGGMALILGGGIDKWARQLRGDGGYQEDYQVRFARVGLESAPGRWHGGLGVLVPLTVDEQVNLYDGVALAPQPLPWFYFDWAFELERTRQFAAVLALSYSGYRFDPSPAVHVTANGVPVDLLPQTEEVDSYALQPKSHSDVVSVALEIHF